MEAAQPSAKIYCSRFELPIRELIGVFHGWIQKRRTGELLIDVHDYSHVHHGPGVILVAHECFYFLDQGEGRPGLVRRKRRGEPVPVRAGLREAVRATARACAFLEEDLAGKIAFDASEVLVGFEDRLAAPNTADVFAGMLPELEALAADLYGAATVEQAGEIPAGPLRARVKTEETTSVAQLAGR
jgi:hypothetical protein